MSLIKRLLTIPAISDFLRKIVEANFSGEKNVIKDEFNSPGESMVLDLASGTGILSTMFSKRVYVGSDIDKNSILFAKGNYKKDFVIADGHTLAFKNNAFRYILVCGLFHHLSDESSIAVLKEIKRVSTRDCLILIMEDIPTVSRYNIVGRIIHLVDQGGFIRTPEEYSSLFSTFLISKRDYHMRSGFCDYHVFILVRE